MKLRNLFILLPVIAIACLVTLPGRSVCATYNDCNPTPTPTATVEPTATPCVVLQEEWKGEEYPTVCPSEEPSSTPTSTPEETATPSPTQTPEETPIPTESPLPTTPPHEDSFTTPSGPFDAPNPSCNPPMDSPKLTGFKKDSDGNPVFSWWPSVSTNVTSQSIVYGYTPNALVYGVNGLDKNQTSFTIKQTDHSRAVWAQVLAHSEGCAVGSAIVDP